MRLARHFAGFKSQFASTNLDAHLFKHLITSFAPRILGCAVSDTRVRSRARFEKEIVRKESKAGIHCGGTILHPPHESRRLCSNLRFLRWDKRGHVTARESATYAS